MVRPEQEALLEERQERQERQQQYEAGEAMFGCRYHARRPTVFEGCGFRFGGCSRQAEGLMCAVLCRVRCHRPAAPAAAGEPFQRGRRRRHPHRCHRHGAADCSSAGGDAQGSQDQEQKSRVGGPHSGALRLGTPSNVPTRSAASGRGSSTVALTARRAPLEATPKSPNPWSRPNLPSPAPPLPCPAARTRPTWRGRCCQAAAWRGSSSLTSWPPC